jgi:hypothetical protein
MLTLHTLEKQSESELMTVAHMPAAEYLTCPTVLLPLWRAQAEA